MSDVTMNYARPADAYRNLLIGCGHARDKRLDPSGASVCDWRGELITLDYESPSKPDIQWDLERYPWSRPIAGREPEPLTENSYNEVHAYEVLEHLGQQGNYKAFFATFSEIWRILKPGGHLCATCPSRRSQWLWGDPGHRRVILPCTLAFLDQRSYNQSGQTTMTDYREVYRADLETVLTHDDNETHHFILRAVKPSRAMVFRL